MLDHSIVYFLILCTFVSIALGFAIAFLYRYKSTYSQNLVGTLVLLPALVQIIIMLVDGNIGVGVAVAGAFSLIRFRSIAGTSRDISYLFFAMAIGFITGLGYIVYAFIFFVIIGVTALFITLSKFGKNKEEIRTLRIKIPENLDYDGVFDEIFEKYTVLHELDTVKTTQMGSIYDLKYTVKLKTDTVPKAFIDDLRIRNGNLGIILSRAETEAREL